jgi:hypothetical protein
MYHRLPAIIIIIIIIIIQRLLDCTFKNRSTSFITLMHLFVVMRMRRLVAPLLTNLSLSYYHLLSLSRPHALSLSLSLARSSAAPPIALDFSQTPNPLPFLFFLQGLGEHDNTRNKSVAEPVYGYRTAMAAGGGWGWGGFRYISAEAHARMRRGEENQRGEY